MQKLSLLFYAPQHCYFRKGRGTVKKICVRLVQSFLLLCVLSVSVYAGNTPYDGYIVKLTTDYPQLFSLENSTAGIIVVDTLVEAEAIPQEYVEYIEPNYIVELFDDVETSDTVWPPNDPYYPDYQQPLQTLDGLALYRAGITGKGVKVGFVDSGINTSHEDLNAANIFGANFHSDGLAFNEDRHGHGTFAAGILAAQTNNNVGLSGMAPDAQIMAYRAFSNNGTSVECVINAIDQAVADGCQVINLSFGMSDKSTPLEEALDRAIESGAVVVAAVGNSGSSTLQYPAAYDPVIGVGSVTLTDGEFVVSSFSQRNDSVFVTAPGEAIAGLGNTKATSYRLSLSSPNNRGTSYAAPVVSALAALAIDYDSDITADGIRYLLHTTALDKGEIGYDTHYGYGVVDPPAFLAELQRDFEISYELNGGQLSETAPTKYTVTDETIPLSVFPSRDGYLFQGWYTDEACTTAITEIPAGSLGDLILYAAWVKAPCFVGITDLGQLQIDSEQTFEEVSLFQADYDLFGKLVSCSITTTTLNAGENYFDLAAFHEDGSYTTFFLSDCTFFPIATCLTLPNTEPTW